MKAGKRSYFRRLRTVENIEIPEFKLSGDPGMLISLNIITQLELLPVEFLKKWSHVGEDDLKKFRAAIQKKHLDFLTKHNSVLICDVTEMSFDKSDNVTDIPSLLIDLPEAKFKEEWIWNFDLKRSDYYGKRSNYKVVAITI
jgi:hypothetical protein